MATEKWMDENEDTKNMSLLAKEVFPQVGVGREAIEARYPARTLPPGAIVSRIAPSPTGFMHLGGLFAALISERLAHQSGGVFYLRIEDTDKKREVEGSDELIIHALETYGIKMDEGKNLSGEDVGRYGPYRQSEREEIYQSFSKWMIAHDRAYLCFCSEENIEKMREAQETKKVKPGYYGEWARCRVMPLSSVQEALAAKKQFVVRFKSGGNAEKTVLLHDLVKGKQELPENDQDMVLIKSDGLPTYHFAHVVDDHLMGTTHVIRGDEWLPSVTLHLQLTHALEWKPLRYGHLAPIQKAEGNSRRKLSKRKDPEANILFYEEMGYSSRAVIEYLLNLANSNFEDWRSKNPDKNPQEFALTLNKLSTTSGALFDVVKLESVGREVVARMNADEIYTEGLLWAKKYDAPLAHAMERDPLYTKAIFNIERDVKSRRKDITKWSDLRREIGYFFDDNFTAEHAAVQAVALGISLEDAKSVVKDFLAVFDPADTKEEWLAKLRQIAAAYGYAEDTKSFKKDPQKYKGYIGDVANVFRVLLTGRKESPDLYQIMRVMGKERVIARLKRIVSL